MNGWDFGVWGVFEAKRVSRRKFLSHSLFSVPFLKMSSP
jgi:hypothetical protein